MKKIALVFVLAVFLPSLVLAWLAVGSLRDQQLILERQQFLLYQGVADKLAGQAGDFLAEQQHEFGRRVEALLAGRNPQTLATRFDDLLRTNWPYAAVGFVVTLKGDLLNPPPAARPATALFCADFGKFLGNRESAQVFYAANSSKGADNNGNFINSAQNLKIVQANSESPGDNNLNNNYRQAGNGNSAVQINSEPVGGNVLKNTVPPSGNNRVIMPKQGSQVQMPNDPQQVSKLAPTEAEFSQLVGDSDEGTVARFVENKLSVLLWHRALADTNLIFGAQLNLASLKPALQSIPDQLGNALREEIAVALLDDNAKPIAVSPAGFQANWKRPFVATEIGESLPHWELAVYPLNPARLAQSARVLELTLGLLIGVLLLAIVAGAWLIVADLNRQLTLARQKTDFVSNVSHELKTPLTSIRMFSELLAEGRVAEPAKRQTYLNIITAETSRLTRLINNVLDFSRLERGEKKYNFQSCDLVALVLETVETYRPHLESGGFALKVEVPGAEITINGDRDALAQVLVNLLSNAEKYSNGAKEITVQVEQFREPLPYAEVRVLDRGSGVPHGCEDKIFEQFYRAHDSLSSGIQGSGLGLTLARQIARAHGGDVIYRPHEGCGSCFILRMPVTDPNTRSTT